MRKSCMFLGAGLLSILLTAAPAGARDRFGVKDFVALPMVGGAAFSPDGSRIAFHITRRDLAKNQYHRQVYLADAATGNYMQITRPPGNSWGAIWTPNNQGLAFYSSRGGKSALYLSRFDGADPKLLCKGPVSGARFSPDGSKLAFLAPGKPAKGAGPGKDPEVWNTIEDRTRWPQLWFLDLATKKRTQLTDGRSHVYQFDWHPAGTSLAFTYDPRGTEGLTEDHHLGLIDLAGKVHILGTGPVKFSHPRWSPDGKRLACFRDRDEEFHDYLTAKDIMVLDPAQGKVLHNLTKAWPGNTTGRLSSPLEDLHWTPDGAWIWFSGAERANLNIYRVKADGSAGVEPLTKVEGEIGGLTFDREFKQVAFGWTDFTHPKDLFTMPAQPSLAEDFQPRQVTRTREKVEKYALRPPRKLLWKSADGTEVEGFLFLPAGYKEGTPAPVVFDAHGGPAFRWGNAFSHRYMWHVFADHGFGSLIFNPRGSTGYGLAFRRGNFKALGQGDFQDLMAAVDMLIKQGITAPDRIGMTGYSYGGYLTNLAISHTTRFKAAVSIAGAFNFASAMGQSNSILPRAYYHPLESPENMRLMLEHSPVSRVMKIETPTLLIHGKRDQAVHYMQAREMFTCLRLCDVPARLILYPGEGHGINRPDHMVHYLEQSVAWLEQYLPGWKENALPGE